MTEEVTTFEQQLIQNYQDNIYVKIAPLVEQYANDAFNDEPLNLINIESISSKYNEYLPFSFELIENRLLMDAKVCRVDTLITFNVISYSNFVKQLWKLPEITNVGFKPSLYEFWRKQKFILIDKIIGILKNKYPFIDINLKRINNRDISIQCPEWSKGMYWRPHWFEQDTFILEFNCSELYKSHGLTIL